MLRILTGVVALLVVLLVARFVTMSATSETPETLGAVGGRLASCPDRPNCVSSTAHREAQSVAPLRVGGDPEAALIRAAEAVADMPRARLIASGDGYLHAEFTSRLFRFVDDLELAYDPAVPGFQVRSASRVGHSDLGANRRRVEALRAKL